MDVRVTLPPGDPVSIDGSELVQLLRTAARALMAGRQMPTLATHTREVFRPAGDGIVSVNVQLPDYVPALLGENVAIGLGTPEVKALTAYLWDHGSEKKDLYGPSPDRSAWELHTAVEVAISPFLAALDRTAVHAAIEGKEIVPWHVVDPLLNEVLQVTAAEIVERAKPLKERKRYAMAYCPLLLQGNLSAPVQLAKGLDLVPWTPQVASELLTLHRVTIGIGDAWFCPPIAAAALRYEFSLPVEEGDTNESRLKVLRTACDEIDLARWALTIASTTNATPAEGPVMCEDRRRRNIITHRREGLKFNFPAPPVEAIDFESCASALREFQIQSTRARELHYAIWHFGRSCLTGLPSDGILEAAMGLDSLLTASADAGYRFRLHGAALLSGSGSTPEELVERFASLWKLRSRLAHGAHLSVHDSEWRDARRLLAAAIRAVVTKMANGQLSSKKSDFSLADAVENFILVRAAAEPN